MPVPSKKVFPSSSYLWLIYTQFFPPKAPLTEANVPDLTGRVFIVTGGNSGVGEQLSRILYQAGGKVYILTRDEAKSKRVISEITANKTPKSGSLHFISVDFTDLSTIAPAVKSFLASESRLDVLFNNAGVGGVHIEQRTSQGLEMHMGINTVGPFLLSKLLYPILTSTSKRADVRPGSVRIIWTASVMVEMMAPEGGVDLSQLDNWSPDRNEHYSASKTANWFLANEFHRRFRDSGVVNIAQNPGSLRTNVWRNTKFREYALFYPIFSRPIDGAHTNLWCGVSPEITIEDGGRYVMPWGRWHPGQREDITQALKTKEEGGTGEALGLWNWCEKTVRDFEM